MSEQELKEGQARLSLDITMKHVSTGEDVPVSISVTYPENQGLYACQALAQLENYGPSLASQLAHDGDASLRQALEEAGLEFISDDELAEEELFEDEEELIEDFEDTYEDVINDEHELDEIAVEGR